MDEELNDLQRYKLNQRVVNDLKKRSTIGIIFYMIITCIVVFTDNYYERHPEFSNQLLFLMIGICLFRLLHLPIAKWTQKKFEKINNGIFILSIIITALIWGVGFAKFMTQGEENISQLLMVVCTVGLCAGGLVAFIPDLRVSVGFISFMLLPGVLTMFFLKINPSLNFAIMLYFIYLSFIGYRGSREYWDALENEYLLEEKSKALKRLSRIDGLTGLYNRRYFDEVFTFEWNRSVRNQTSISVIIGDIDLFKQINDNHGHPAGDQYLKEISRLLGTIFQRTTDIIARYGGEEFVVLMPGENSETACKQSEIFRSAVEQFQLKYDDKTIQSTISLGVAAITPNQNDKMESLISKADKALYQSKNSGRNKVTGS